MAYSKCQLPHFLHQLNFILSPLSQAPVLSAACTHTATEAAGEAPIADFLQWRAQTTGGQLLGQLKCQSVYTLMKKRVLHARVSQQAASWTVLLHDISNTGAKMQSQVVLPALLSTSSCRSCVPRGKWMVFDKEKLCFLFLKHRS